MIFTYNIGYSGLGTGSILNSCPEFFNFDSLRDLNTFRDQENIEVLFGWAEVNHVPPSWITIYFTLIDSDYSHSGVIKMINVREYLAHWEKTYNKKYEKSWLNAKNN
jgi:hypothetical protein